MIVEKSDFRKRIIEVTEKITRIWSYINFFYFWINCIFVISKKLMFNIFATFKLHNYIIPEVLYFFSFIHSVNCYFVAI